MSEETMNNRTISEEDYNKKNAWGLLTSINLFGCNPEIIKDGEKIRNYSKELSDLIGMKRFGEPLVVRFGNKPEVHGYSLVQLIETSSITGHFAEESNSAYIDVFSCKFYNQKKAVEFTKRFFDAKKASYNIIVRGLMI